MTVSESASTGTDFRGEPNADLASAEEFAQIARMLPVGTDLEATLARICALAVERIDGCVHAGVSLAERRRISTRGATDDVAARVDAVQYATNEGPCLDAIRQHEICHAADLSAETRWPLFAPAVVESTGVRSVLSFRLFVDRVTLGALNLYSRRPDAFDDHVAAEWGSVFATHAAVALRSAQDSQGMTQALESRATIGVAMGMLMARQGMTQQEAFDVLRRASQRLNVKLRTIASQVAGGNVAIDELAKADPAVNTRGGPAAAI